MHQIVITDQVFITKIKGHNKLSPPFWQQEPKRERKSADPMITSGEEDDEERRSGAPGRRQSVPLQTGPEEEHCQTGPRAEDKRTIGPDPRDMVINPTGRRVPDLSMRDDGGGKLVGERRWLPDYHNQDGVAP
jgi:hypothetical protein